MYNIQKFQELSQEEVLLIATSRLSIQDNEKLLIEKIVYSQNINWFEFAKIALYHKTLCLCWKNIKSICPKCHIPKYLESVIHYVYECTKVKNECYYEELCKLKEKFSENDITCIPVKGLYLIENLYKDYGIRYSGDMDFLVEYDDTSILNEILTEMGYISGRYSDEMKKIVPVSRKDEIMWKMYMSNLHPYCKLSNNNFFTFYKLDFRYALDDTLNKEPVREIVEATKANGGTPYEYYFVHLCTHFYDEAKHSLSILMAKDINMIKLCDIREFVIKYLSKDGFNDVISFAHKYNLEKAVYYTLHYLNEVYCDGYEKKIMSLLNIDDFDFLNTYGESTLNDVKQFNKNFWERFFSCKNSDELSESPHFFLNK